MGHYGRAQTFGIIPPMSNIGGIRLRPVAESSGSPLGRMVVVGHGPWPMALTPVPVFTLSRW